MLRKSVYWSAAGVAEYHESETRPVKDDEVLIANHYSLISQSSEHSWFVNDKAHVVLGTTFPFIPGYSAAGYVEEVGKNVTKFKPGDKVIGAPVTGAHSNFTYVEEINTYHVPDNVALDDAVFYNLGMTALFTLDKAALHLGQSVAIIGAGVVGQIAIQGAKADGLHPIIAFDIQEQRRQAAKDAGADYVLDPNDSAAVESLISELGGGVDAALDVSGSNAGMNLAIHLAKPLGEVIFCTANNDDQTLRYGELFMKNLTLKGDFVNTEWDRQRKAISNFLWLLSAGKIKAPQHADTIYEPTDENIKMLYGKVLQHDNTINNPIFKWRE
ncbi:zinc-dependent alcohol dehydrogenase [Secundilactobacillus muriivasis]